MSDMITPAQAQARAMRVIAQRKEAAALRKAQRAVAAAREDLARLVAERAADAFMCDVYGPTSWRVSASYLLARGLDAAEVEAFLRSKHMRWADDEYGRGIGNRAPTSTSLRRYVESKELRCGAGWLAAEANSLVLAEAL